MHSFFPKDYLSLDDIGLDLWLPVCRLSHMDVNAP